jgi:hypothetical protein
MAKTPSPAETVPDAYPDLPDPDELAGLVLGPPFAQAGDCELLERDPSSKCESCGLPEVHGATCIVRCECGQMFRVDLLSSGAKPCPANCGRNYTHVLLVANVVDDEIFADCVTQILRSNGFEVAQSPDDDDDGDPADGDDDDDGQGEPDDDDDEPEQPGDDK